MNKQLHVIMLIIILLFFPITSHANKIQTDENWIYEDSNKTIYNETSIDTIQLKTIDDEFMAVSIINTARRVPRMPSSLIINETFDNINIFVELAFNSPSNRLYLTQEGGFPLFSNEKLIGPISVSITDKLNKSHNKQYDRMFNADITTNIGGKPSRAIITSETDTFVYSGEVNMINTAQDNYLYFRVLKEYTISSNQAIIDDIRNYTLTPYYSKIYYHVGPNTNEGFFEFEMITTPLNTQITLFYVNHLQNFEIYKTIIVKPIISLDYYEEDSMLFTFDVTKKLPVYIKQTEPVKISSGLSLSQLPSFETVEYFLNIDPPIITNITETSTISTNDIISISTTKTTTTEESPFFAIVFIPVMIILIIIKKIIVYQK